MCGSVNGYVPVKSTLISCTEYLQKKIATIMSMLQISKETRNRIICGANMGCNMQKTGSFSHFSVATKPFLSSFIGKQTIFMQIETLFLKYLQD